MANIYDKYVLPKVVNWACKSKPTMYQRAKIIPLAFGNVLEIGIGSGLNLAYYNHKKVDAYVATCQVGITLSSLILGFYGQSQLSGYISPLLSFGAKKMNACAIINILLIILFSYYFHSFFDYHVNYKFAFPFLDFHHK